MEENKKIQETQDEEIKLANLLKNRVDVKKETIRIFNSIYNATRRLSADQPEPFNNQVYLVTTQAIISGTIFDDCSNSEKINDGIQTLEDEAFKYRNDYFNALESNNESLQAINNSSIIIVRNATIRPLSNMAASINLPILYLFACDVIGFTVAGVNKL